MASELDIKKCFETYLANYSTSSGIDVSYPGVTYTPVEGVDYIDFTFMPGRPEQKELVGANTRDRFGGWSQFDITTKLGSGMNTIYTHYNGLQGIFNRGTGLTYTNGSGETILVEINKFYMGDLNEGGSPWMYLPVFVQWRSDIWVG